MGALRQDLYCLPGGFTLGEKAMGRTGASRNRSLAFHVHRPSENRKGTIRSTTSMQAGARP